MIGGNYRSEGTITRRCQLLYGASFPLVVSIVESSSEDDDDDDGDEEDNIELSKLSLVLLLLLFGIILSSCVEWNDPVDDDDIIEIHLCLSYRIIIMETATTYYA